MTKEMFIYEIINDLGEPVYVGKTDDVKKRMIGHLSGSKYGKSPIHKWVREANKPIKYRIYCKCTDSNASSIEIDRINELYDSGYPILNVMSVKKETSTNIEEVPYNTITAYTKVCFILSREQEMKINKAISDVFPLEICLNKNVYNIQDVALDTVIEQIKLNRIEKEKKTGAIK